MAWCLAAPSHYLNQCWLIINTLRPRQDGRNLPDDIFKRFFLNENVWISIKISLKFVLAGRINSIPTLVEIMVWRWPGDKPLSDPMVVCSTDAYMRHSQGWGQFHFFNSIPIPLFSIPNPIPIPLLTISFNSNSGDFNSNSNSNSGDFKSRQSYFWKWPIDVFFEIDYNYTNKVHTYEIIVINTISLISLVKWL